MLTNSQEIAKRCARFAVHKLGGGRSAEQFTGIDDTRLSRCGNENEPKFQIHLFEFLDLNAATAHEAIKYLAAQYGLEIISAQQKRELADMARLFGQAAKKGADLLAVTVEAGSDGVCSNHEARKIAGARTEAFAAQNDLADAVLQMPRIRAVS